jgi:hypothetical protein
MQTIPVRVPHLSYLSLHREVYLILFHFFLYIERYIICHFNDVLYHNSLFIKEVYRTSEENLWTLHLNVCGLICARTLSLALALSLLSDAWVFHGAQVKGRRVLLPARCTF